MGLFQKGNQRQSRDPSEIQILLKSFISDKHDIHRVQLSSKTRSHAHVSGLVNNKSELWASLPRIKTTFLPPPKKKGKGKASPLKKTRKQKEKAGQRRRYSRRRTVGPYFFAAGCGLFRLHLSPNREAQASNIGLDPGVLVHTSFAYPLGR